MALIGPIATAPTIAQQHLGEKFLRAARASIDCFRDLVPSCTAIVCGSVAANVLSVVATESESWVASDLDVICVMQRERSSTLGAHEAATRVLDAECSRRLPTSRFSLKTWVSGEPVPIEEQVALWMLPERDSLAIGAIPARLAPEVDHARGLTKKLMWSWGLAKFAMLFSQDSVTSFDALYQLAKGLRSTHDLSHVSPSLSVSTYRVRDLRRFVANRLPLATSQVFPDSPDVAEQIQSAVSGIGLPYSPDGNIDVMTRNWVSELRSYVHRELPETRLATVLASVQ